MSFFFTCTPSISSYTLSLHDALPISDDVRSACDVLAPLVEQTGGLDGRVSIEVDPRLAHDTEATIEQAKQLWDIRSEEHTSELQSRGHLVCRLLLEKKNINKIST